MTQVQPRPPSPTTAPHQSAMPTTASPINKNPLDWWKFTFLQNFGNFSGRARRWEYGIAHFFYVAMIAVAAGLGVAVQSSDTLSSIVAACIAIAFLASAIPYLALTVRRFHDLGMSAWMLLVTLIPLFGLVLQLLLFFSSGVPGMNKFGQSPKLSAR